MEQSEARYCPTQPIAVLRAPEAAILAAIQIAWSQLRKRVHLLILLDVNSAPALVSTADAVKTLSTGDVVEVWVVAVNLGRGSYRDVLSPTTVGEGTTDIVAAIKSAVAAQGPAPIFAATGAAYAYLRSAPDATRINAVVLIAAALDDGSGPTLADLERQLKPLATGILVRVYAVAFPGSDSAALQGIARASDGVFSQGEPGSALRAALTNT